MPMDFSSPSSPYVIGYKEIHNTQKGNRIRPGDRLVPSADGKRLVSERHQKSAFGEDQGRKRDLEKKGDVIVPIIQAGGESIISPSFEERFPTDTDFNIPMESTVPTVQFPLDRTASPTVEGGPPSNSGVPPLLSPPPIVSLNSVSEEFTTPRSNVATDESFEPISLDAERKPA